MKAPREADPDGGVAAVGVGPALPPTRRGREMRRRLVAAAAEVFAERGYGDTRVSDIAAAAGTALGNFYRHFENKNDALLAALAEPLDELLDRTGPAGDGTGVPTVADLTAWNAGYFTVYASHRRLYRVMREAAAAGGDDGFADLWKAQRQRFGGRIQAWLEQLSAVGHAKLTADSALMAEAMVAMLEQLSYVHLGLAEEDPTAAQIAGLSETVGRLWYRCLGRESTP